METVLLGLGSNKGNSLDILHSAVDSLKAILQFLQISSVYKTKPQIYTNQDDFFNMVVAGRYAGMPEELLAEIQKIEKKFGRNRSIEISKGPRTLDIDIIFFGCRIISIEEPPLCIPHPAAEQRQFVLIPLLELFPAMVSPLSGRKLRTVCESLPPQGVVRAGRLGEMF